MTLLKILGIISRNLNKVLYFLINILIFFFLKRNILE